MSINKQPAIHLNQPMSVPSFTAINVFNRKKALNIKFEVFFMGQIRLQSNQYGREQLLK